MYTHMIKFIIYFRRNVSFFLPCYKFIGIDLAKCGVSICLPPTQEKHTSPKIDTYEISRHPKISTKKPNPKHPPKKGTV